VKVSVALLATAVAAATATAAAQVSDLPLVSQAEARSHLTSSTSPRLPMLAGASGIKGPVLLQVDVSPEGRVVATRVLHGTPLLEQAAIEAVSAWRFSPLQRGDRAVAYRTTIAAAFPGDVFSAEEATGLVLFSDALLVCVDAGARSDAAVTERRCHLAGNLAERLSAVDRLLPNRPRRLQAEALVELGHHEEAIGLFVPIDVRMRSIPFFSLDRTLALRGLGRAYAALGRRDEALTAYGQADRQLNEALNGAPRNSPFRTEVAGYLQQMAPGYIALLEQAGRTGDAARVRATVGALR
jgi:TonB family protein